MASLFCRNRAVRWRVHCFGRHHWHHLSSSCQLASPFEIIRRGDIFALLLRHDTDNSNRLCSDCQRSISSTSCAIHSLRSFSLNAMAQRCALISMTVISAGSASFALCGCQKMSGNHPSEFKKGSQLIIRARDEAVSIAAMGVSNPDSFPVGINR